MFHSKTIVFLVALLCATKLCAQLPNDCVDAVVVCGNQELNLDVNGTGLPENAVFLCNSGENNSLWLRVSIATSGTLGFTLTPESTSIVEDYDFWVFPANNTCDNLGTSIRCSTTNPQASGQANNLTGMNDTEVDTSEGPGAAGNSFVRSLDVVAGEFYYIMIDRPVGNSAFSLTWTGTATLADPITENNYTLNEFSLSICDEDQDGNVELDFSALNDLFINPTPIGTRISYHSNESDAITDTNPLTVNSISSGTYYVRLTDNASECFIYDDFEIDLTNSPSSENHSEVLCNNGTNLIDLSDFDEEVYTGNSSVIITYHSSEDDATDNNNPITSINGTIGTNTVFVRVTDVTSVICFTTSTLTIEIVEPPFVTSTPNNLEVCDSDGNGSENIDLTQNENLIQGNQNNVSFSYHNSMIEAQNNQNPINNVNATNFNVGTNTVWVRLENDLNTNCFVVSSFDVSVHFLPETETIETLELCENVNVDFDLINVFNSQIYTGNEVVVISYHSNQNDALMNQNPITNYTANVGLSSVWVRVGNPNSSECRTISEINFDVEANPAVTADSVSLNSCLPAGTTDVRFNLTQFDSEIIANPNNFTITYHENQTNAESGNVSINNPNDYLVTSSPTIVFARVESARGCFSIKEIQIEYQIELEGNIDALIQCDVDNINDFTADGMSVFNLNNLTQDVLDEITNLGGNATAVTFHLSETEAGGGANPIANTASFMSGSTTIYARGTLNLNCVGIIEVPLVVADNPTLSFSREGPYEFCPGENTELSAIGNFISITWQAPNGQIVSMQNSAVLDQTGTYTITASFADGCQTVETIDVINSDQPIITNIQISQDQNVTIFATGEQPVIEYQIDGTDENAWQNINQFSGLEPGVHLAYVRNSIGCISNPVQFVIIDIPNAFTPNADGVNDVWSIAGIEFLEGSNIQLFDRYGKIIFNTSISNSNSFNWDGTYLGKNLPSGDYWYIIEASNGLKYTGHVTLKNQ